MARTALKNVCRLIDIAQKELPAEQSFLEDLKKSIEITASQDSRTPSRTYKPSSMNCIRNMYYQVMGVEPDPNTMSYNFVGICDSGTDIHLRMQSAVSSMKANGFDCDYINVAEFVRERQLDYLDIKGEPNPDAGVYETKLYHKNLNMSFLCDGIIRYKGKYYIIEFKTETNNKWYSREGVDPKHYAQGTAYSIAFGIEDVLFVYIDRDMLNIKTFMFIPSSEQKQELIGKIDECAGYVNRQICPPKPDIPKKICEYCSYRQSCRKDG